MRFLPLFLLFMSVQTSAYGDSIKLDARELNAESSMESAKLQYLKAMELYLLGAKRMQLPLMKEASRQMIEAFFHDAFLDIVIPHNVRLSTLEAMASDLEDRLLSNQAILGSDQIRILEDQVNRIYRFYSESPPIEKKGALNAWGYGVMSYVGVESVYHGGRLTKKAFLDFLTDYRTYRSLKQSPEAKGWRELRRRVNKERAPGQKLSPKERCQKIFKALGASSKSALKFAGRSLVGGAVLGALEYKLFLEDYEPYAISLRVLEFKIKPALKNYQRRLTMPLPH